MVKDEFHIDTVVDTVVDRIILEIDKLTKLNGKPPKKLTVDNEVKAKIIENQETKTEELNEFKGITVHVIPNNTLLRWCLE